MSIEQINPAVKVSEGTIHEHIEEQIMLKKKLAYTVSQTGKNKLGF